MERQYVLGQSIMILQNLVMTERKHEKKKDNIANTAPIDKIIEFSNETSKNEKKNLQAKAARHLLALLIDIEAVEQIEQIELQISGKKKDEIKKQFRNQTFSTINEIIVSCNLLKCANLIFTLLALQFIEILQKLRNPTHNFCKISNSIILDNYSAIYAQIFHIQIKTCFFKICIGRPNSAIGKKYLLQTNYKLGDWEKRAIFKLHIASDTAISICLYLKIACS
ncbi:MAG: hypothetical protein EZS28_019304 [Streblomastix strix]|uniref:Uncharacterized protein n=1 Tax=Streblomastix strix TaxID=222440 RepID=A0A5J4VRZ4_9EUKA|nr:MAG: hypothetical protein EZS28_019304 [Streblomastix strix]